MTHSQASAWRAMSTRGLAELSPPEVEHSMLELPTNRAEYVGMLQDVGDYPARSPIGQRVPDADEVAVLARTAGRWRAVVLLDDERALRNAAGLFNRIFVLDPFYDSGALLYAAWHDPLIRDEHSRRLAEQAGLLVRAAPLLNTGTAVLAPDHLPGSWNPRPGWRRPKPADSRQMAAWSLRSSLVLLYWADRLDGVVCTARREVIAGLDLALAEPMVSCALEMPEAPRLAEAQAAREACADELGLRWAAARRASRRRGRRQLEDVAASLVGLAEVTPDTGEPRGWRLALGQRSLPDPAMLLRRVLNGQDPERAPRLPRTRMRHRPLCLMAAAESASPG